MDVHITAALLLIPHLVSAFFMGKVLWVQYPLFKAQNNPEVRTLRWILFIFAILILIGNIIPITVDTLTIFHTVKRSSTNINAIGLFYTFSNAATALLSAVLFWLIYRVAERTTLAPQE